MQLLQFLYLDLSFCSLKSLEHVYDALGKLAL